VRMAIAMHVLDYSGERDHTRYLLFLRDGIFFAFDCLQHWNLIDTFEDEANLSRSSIIINVSLIGSQNWAILILIKLIDLLYDLIYNSIGHRFTAICECLQVGRALLKAFPLVFGYFKSLFWRKFFNKVIVFIREGRHVYYCFHTYLSKYNKVIWTLKNH
jgi:hypothetical protein